MDQYSIVCQWSDEDEGYIALVPELKGVSAFGETPAEALAELEIAKKLHIRVHEEDGCPLPDPRKLPEFSGQLRLRLPKSLHEELSRAAEIEGSSLNTYIVSLLGDRNRLARMERDINQIKQCYFNTVLSGEISNSNALTTTPATESISQKIEGIWGTT